MDRAIDVGLPYFEHQIGTGWYGSDGTARWSGRMATIYLPGPTHPGQVLRIHGWVTRRMLAAGPIHVDVAAGACQLPTKTIARRSSEFTLEYVLPEKLIGASTMQVKVQVDRVLRIPPDVRELGLILGQFSIR